MRRGLGRITMLRIVHWNFLGVLAIAQPASMPSSRSDTSHHTMAPVTIMRAVICDAAATSPSATPTLIHFFDRDGGSAACDSSRGRALALITLSNWDRAASLPAEDRTHNHT